MSETPTAPLRPGFLPRRAFLAGGLALPLLPQIAWAAATSLTFAVLRNGSKIGEHHVAFNDDGGALTATTDAVMTVKIGPVPVFRYHHHAIEHRKDGAFTAMETATTTNGKQERIICERAGGGLRMDGTYGKTTLSADTQPLNHWNPQIFAGSPPVFNPQTGKVLKVRTAKVGPGHFTIRGETDIDDFYDDGGAWKSLTGKLDDGSKVEYRRI